MRSPALLVALVAASITSNANCSTASQHDQRWTSPFQAGQPFLLPNRWRTLPASRCDRSDPLAKCTFTARVDYNGDRRFDLARLVEGGGISAIIVDLGGSMGKPLLAATFKGRWNGSCYIAADATDRTAIAFTCPEASAALFKLRGGKPAALWLAD